VIQWTGCRLRAECALKYVTLSREMGIAVLVRHGGVFARFGAVVATFGMFFGVSLAGYVARAECTATPALEARIHDNPDVGAYTELGMWFAQQQQF